MSIDLRFSDLPDFNLWLEKSPENIELFFLLEVKGRSFAAVLKIINPIVEKIDGLYLLIAGNHYDLSNLQYLKDNFKDHSEIEYRWNRYRIQDLFYHDPEVDDLSTNLLTDFGQEILKYWKLNISQKFPDIVFEFGIILENIDPEIYFYVNRFVDKEA